ncbi:hypothetical protein [Paenibacillus sp. FSL R7-0273]|uniref:hypothetical protein n=1 Tax=Paenibacillus sp. FSL R7-0273 TaxID=1536772 RepID=UPI0005877455|nr:hypothetical protein [Paenibacillus sp. FSL R7-0273]OMF95160.1 hypothetical protein BK144_06385 [Paenibacillus sp. FSL R7-0273]
MKMNIGQTVEIVYQDKAGQITQRKIEINNIRDGRIRATCLTTGSPRVFLWDASKPIQTAVLLAGWERNVPYDTTPQGGTQTARDGGNIDYWLYH